MKKNKNIEELAKYVIQEAALESPSKGFVDNVMASIETQEITAEVPEYQPVISKKGWLFIFALIVAIAAFVVVGNFENPQILATLDFSFLERVNSSSLFEGLKISNIFLISTLLFAVFAVLQLLTIKNFVNRQLSS